MGALCSFTKKRGSIRFLLGNEGSSSECSSSCTHCSLHSIKVLLPIKKKDKKKEGFKFDAGH